MNSATHPNPSRQPRLDARHGNGDQGGEGLGAGGHHAASLGWAAGAGLGAVIKSEAANAMPFAAATSST